MLEPLRRLFRGIWRWYRYRRHDEYVPIKDEWIRSDFRV